MAEKSAAEKLGLKPGQGLMLLHPVDNWQAVIGPLPPTARVIMAGPADVALLFAHTHADLHANLPALAACAPARLWLAYAKLTSPLAGALNRAVIHDLTPAYGLDTIAQIALDADWSAMRFKLLPAPPQ